MATQVQRRRGTAAQNDALTGAAGEWTHDTTNNRIRAHDGSTAGGFHVPNHRDIQNAAMIKATAGGSANALTVTLAPALAAYADGQAFLVKAASTNTGAATVNFNSLGARDLRKIVGGSKTALAAGDLVAGLWYWMIPEGSQVLVLPVNFAGSVYKTSTGTPLLSGNNVYSEAHGLGSTPNRLSAFIECQVTDASYSVGDRIFLPNTSIISFGASRMCQLLIGANATNVFAVQDDSVTLANFSTQAQATLTVGGSPAEWRLFFVAEAI